MNIESLSALGLARLIQTGELSCVDATRHFLDQIQRIDGQVNAFVDCNERALQDAEEADAEIRSGQIRSPLAGVPFAAKDVLCTADMKTTCGSQMLSEFQPPYTATAIQNLRDAGLVLLGKTNMDEFAMGGSTETSIHGVTRNPWNLQRTPGGSSGGAAAAVAGGMAPLSIGTDTGGSVRQPGAFCGVVGLKPTYGRISRYGLVAFASSLDQVGLLSHSVDDIAAGLSIVAKHDPRDSTSLNEPAEQYQEQLDAPLDGLRVGIIREHIEHSAVQPAIKEAVLRAQTALEDLGAKSVDVRLPHTDYAVPTYYLIAPSEASGNLSRYDGVHYGFRQLGKGESPLESMIGTSRSAGFGAEVKRRIMLGTFALSAGYYDAYYKKALQVRRLIAGDYQKAFEQVDLLLGPVTPTTAFGIGDMVDDPVQMYLQDLFTVSANLAGIPAISIPAGFDSESLPLGVQLYAPALGESKLLNAAHQLQQNSFFERRIATVS